MLKTVFYYTETGISFKAVWELLFRSRWSLFGWLMSPNQFRIRSGDYGVGREATASRGVAPGKMAMSSRDCRVIGT